MKKTLILLCAVALILSGATAALAQAQAPAPMGPPKLLQIIREEVKVGKGPAHEKNEVGYPQAFKKAKWPTNFLAITSITGPSEAWFLIGYDSFEAWEKDRQAIEKNTALIAELNQLDAKDAEFVSGTRSLVAVYREDLSHRPGMNIAQMRYFRMLTFRVRPGHEADFGEAVKIVRAGYEKADVEIHWAVFQISSGMPGPTFLVFAPTKSLKEVDVLLAQAPKVQAAEGEDGVKKLQKLAADGYLTIESNIYAFSPKMSYVSKELAAGDPDFWTPKPKAAAKPAEGASAEKKETKKPTAPPKKDAAKKAPGQ
jgi:hypothetical protein